MLRGPVWEVGASSGGPQSVLVVLAAALVLLSGALLAPGLVVGPSLDAAVFTHIGERVLHGVIPYVGTWDHKPPGIYVLSAAAHALLGWLGPWTADWLVSVGATAGIGLSVAGVLTRLGMTGPPRAMGAIAATLVAGQYLLALGGGLTEAPAAFLVATALILALGPGALLRSAAIGFLVGMSLLLSVQLVPGAAVVLFLALLLQPAGSRLTSGGVMGLGFLILAAGVAAWLGANGAIPSAFEAILRYSTAYRGSSGQYGAILAAPVAAWTVLASLLLTGPALLGAVSFARNPRLTRTVLIASMLWIGMSVVLFVVQGRFYAHYAIPLAIPLGILAGSGLQRVGESLRRASRSSSRALIVLPLVFAASVSVLSGVVSGVMQLAPVADESARIQDVSKRIGHLPAGTLLVWGNVPRLYDLAGRVPATRYSYLFPLTTPGFSTVSMIDNVRRELAAAPPAVVVDAGSSAPGQAGFLPLLIDRPIATDGRDLDLLDPLRSFVAERYELAATVAGWPIYVLRTDLEPAT
jgi:hypothetical protein